jgi:hypothetical protein
MSTLQLEQKKTCGGCGISEIDMFAEFNHKLFCPQCFKQEIENRIKLVS